MFREGKYVIVRSDSGEVPIVFSALIDHINVVKNTTPVSAGFFRFGLDGHVMTHGKSTTLDLVSRIGDAEIIKHEFFTESMF